MKKVTTVEWDLEVLMFVCLRKIRRSLKGDVVYMCVCVYIYMCVCEKQIPFWS